MYKHKLMLEKGLVKPYMCKWYMYAYNGFMQNT